MPSIANKISTLDVMNLIKRQGALTGVTSGLESGTNQAAGHVKHATKGLSQMQLLAVAIVVAVVVVLSGFGLWWACSYKRNKRKAAQEEEDRRKLVQNQNEQYQTRERTSLKRESDWQRF